MENDLAVCAFCRKPGKHGAEWLLQASGQADQTVHKPCGDQAVATAPAGVRAKVVPSQKLRDRWKAERDAKNAKAFWGDKFAQATAAKQAAE